MVNDVQFTLTFLSKYRPLSSVRGKFYVILVNCIKCSHGYRSITHSPMKRVECREAS